MSPRTVTIALPSVGVVADCNSGAMVASSHGAVSLQGPGQPLLSNRSAGGCSGLRLRGGDWSHVGRLGAFLALGDVELDGLAVLQRAAVLDGADVDEDVVAGLGLDEAVALVGVEPLHGANSHPACPPSVSSEVSTTPVLGGASGMDKLDCAAAK